jgi:hypothetical protein
MVPEEDDSGPPEGPEWRWQVSLRSRVLIGCAVFLSILFGAIVVGVVETAQIIGQRSGPPLVTEGWMLVELVVRVPPDSPPSPVRDIFLNATELRSLAETLWIEDENHPPRVRLFQAPDDWVPREGYEYIPHVIVFENIPGDAIEADSLEKLAGYGEQGLVGLVFFAGDLFGGDPGCESWWGSPIADILPIDMEDVALVQGMEARVKIKDRGFSPFKGFDFSTFPRIEAVVGVTAKPGAKVAATAESGGEEYPLLVWWEVNGARIIVWTGSFDDVYGWDTEEFFESGGREGGPLFARNLVCFAAEGGDDGGQGPGGYGSFSIVMDEYEPDRVAGLRVYIDRGKVKSDEEARQLGQLVWDYVYIAPGVVRSGLEPGGEYVLTEEFVAKIKQALAQESE